MSRNLCSVLTMLHLEIRKGCAILGDSVALSLQKLNLTQCSGGALCSPSTLGAFQEVPSPSAPIAFMEGRQRQSTGRAGGWRGHLGSPDDSTLDKGWVGFCTLFWQGKKLRESLRSFKTGSKIWKSVQADRGGGRWMAWRWRTRLIWKSLLRNPVKNTRIQWVWSKLLGKALEFP